MQKYQRYEYIQLLLSGELDTYLYQLNEECYEYLQKLVEQIKEAAGITLTMKQTDFMRWIGQVNNIYSTAEEIILKEMVYNERL